MEQHTATANTERHPSALPEEIFEQIPSGLVLLDGAGRVSRANCAALSMLGEPLLGESWLAVIQRTFCLRPDDGHEVSLRSGLRVQISTQPLTEQVGQLSAFGERQADVLTLIESHLFEKRLDALLMPSTQPVDGPIGSGFGFRSDPFTGRPALHTGLDFPADPGTTIVAAAGGVVLSAGPHPQYGLLVELDHGNGLVTRYAHTSRMLVKQGDLGKRGQRIAEVGNTGRSTGPHLHFEVLVDGVQQNPARFLQAAGGNNAAKASR